MLRAVVIGVVAFAVLTVSVAGAAPSPMRLEGTAAPYAYSVVSDGQRFVAFEVRDGERRLTRIIDAREGERFRVRPPAGCSTDDHELAGLVAVSGGKVLWNCLPDPGRRSSHNTRKNPWLFDLSDRRFHLPAGMAEMRACYDSFEWVGVGSRWLEAAVGRHTCDGMGATPHFLDHRTGEVVADGYRQRSDQAPNLDAEVVVETLCPGLRRTVTRSGSARPFQAERGFGISPWDSQERRGTLRLQRCNRSPLRVAHCRDGCYSVQLGKRFLTWLDRERGVHAYSLAGGEVTRWMVPDAHSVAHTRKRIFVLSGRNHRVRSARLPRPAS